jgi:hypothetical protein
VFQAKEKTKATKSRSKGSHTRTISSEARLAFARLPRPTRPILEISNAHRLKLKGSPGSLSVRFVRINWISVEILMGGIRPGTKAAYLLFTWTLPLCRPENRTSQLFESESCTTTRRKNSKMTLSHVPFKLTEYEVLPQSDA